MQPLRVSESSFSANRPPGPIRFVPAAREVGPTLLRTSDDRAISVPGDGTPLTLGRRSTNDVRFDHPRVSRHHAELRLHNGQLMVRDSGSSYGTYLNGCAIPPRRWVAVPEESEVVLGQGGPRLQLGGEAGPDLVQLGPAAPPPQTPAAPGLTRDTVGWSGEGPHRRLIERGVQAMDRMAPGFRCHLDRLLDPSNPPEVQARLDALSGEQMELYAQNGKLMALPLERVEGMLGSAALEQRRQLEARVDTIQHEVQSLQADQLDRQAEGKRKATDLAGAFLKKLRESNSRGENVAARVTFDWAALQKLAEKGLEPAQVKAWVNDFYHQTGLPAPKKLDFRYLDGRPRYLHQSGVINIGDYFDKKICLHELAHRIEFDHPELSRANKGWVAGRCAASGFDPTQPASLRRLAPNAKYEQGEVAQEDHFLNPYVGKVYPDAATEVLSTGLEHFTDGARLVQLYQQDPEQFFLVLGALEVARCATG